MKMTDTLPVHTHSFQERLAFSHRQSELPLWEKVYRKAFPDFASMTSVRKDGWAQRGGIDRVITLACGKTLTVDEKIREKDYSDILLEQWSDRDRSIPGWAAKDLACDYIAYAFLPSRRCYLLPFQQLRRSWRNFEGKWETSYGTIEARNSGYVTVSIPVPISILLDTLKRALIIGWE